MSYESLTLFKLQQLSGNMLSNFLNILVTAFPYIEGIQSLNPQSDNRSADKPEHDCNTLLDGYLPEPLGPLVSLSLTRTSYTTPFAVIELSSILPFLALPL